MIFITKATNFPNYFSATSLFKFTKAHKIRKIYFYLYLYCVLLSFLI